MIWFDVLVWLYLQGGVMIGVARVSTGEQVSDSVTAQNGLCQGRLVQFRHCICIFLHFFLLLLLLVPLALLLLLLA